jgi:hypothetical protein
MTSIRVFCNTEPEDYMEGSVLSELSDKSVELALTDTYSVSHISLDVEDATRLLDFLKEAVAEINKGDVL